MRNPLRVIRDWWSTPRQALAVHDGPGFWGSIWGTIQGKDGEVVGDQRALTYSAVWAATRLLSGTIGVLPLDLYRRLPGKRGREVVTDDIRELLVHDRPNPEMTAIAYRACAVGQQVNAGNTYSWIERDVGKKPMALWPIHYSRVEVVRDEDTDEIFYKVRIEGKPDEFYPQRDVLHVPSMISDDGIIGKGVIKNARLSIGFGLATEKYGSNWFTGDGIPRVVVTHPGKPSPEARKNFRKEWDEIHGGPRGSKVALAAEGMDIKVLNISAEDSQFLETRQHNIEEIARWYGVPPHMIQHLLRATFNNIEHQQIEFVTFSLLPWLKLWEQELWAKLLTEEEQKEMYFEFNVNALLRGDAKTRGEFYRAMVSTAIYSPNECREFENMNPYEGGEQYFMQGAMVPVDMIAEQMQANIDKMNEPAPAPAPAGPDTVAKEQAIKRAAVAMVHGGIARMVHKESAAARRAAKKPDEFLAWLDAFYGRHEAYIEESIEHAAKALEAIGVTCSVRELAADLCEQSRSELLDVAGTAKNGEQLSEQVEALVSKWEKSRARETVAKLFGKDLAA